MKPRTNRILVDTLFWIEHQRGNPRAQPLNELLRAGIKPAGTEPVRMEVLAGAKNSREYSDVVSIFQSIHWIKIQPQSDFDAAAQMYFQARRTGLTPGGLLDCLIVAIAQRSKSSLMTLDRNQMAVARLFDVEIVD